ncbi:hypothetical protein BJX99DRAFT_223102 [Aspergillus californicus]
MTPKPQNSASTSTSALPSTSASTTTLLRLANYTVFTFLSIILLCLILLTPADAIYQCYVTHRLTNIFIITGGYVVTFLLAVLIYATRIYTNRSVLGGIPKAWIPVEKEDVGKSVRRIVVEGLGRSALVAWGARPRDLTSSFASPQHAGGDNGQEEVNGHGDADEEGEEKKGLLRGFDFDIDPDHPPWGHIEHPGWSAPSSHPSSTPSANVHLPPGLCYRTVIRELPHLIEAKAVSLAPPDPVLSPRNHTFAHTHSHGEEETDADIPDTRILAILRRPATLSLRAYLTHLSALEIISPPELSHEFLALYERARFSGRDLSESEFGALMSVFADLLRQMRFSIEQLDMNLDMDGRGRGPMRDGSTFGTRSEFESVIGPSDEEGETETENETENENESVHRPRHGYNYTTADSIDMRSRGRGRWARTPSPSMRSSNSNLNLHSVQSNVSGSGSGSGSSGSSSALTSGSSGFGSGSGGSVIRLADARTESVSGLPYVLNNTHTSHIGG